MLNKGGKNEGNTTVSRKGTRGIGFELNNTLLWRVAVLHMQQSCYLVFQFHHAMPGWMEPGFP